MGKRTPKSNGRSGRTAKLEELSDQVKDAIAFSEGDDPVLYKLLEIVISSLNSKRPLFENILDEPSFYRHYFLQWVKEGMNEKRNLVKSEAKTNKELGLG